MTVSVAVRRFFIGCLLQFGFMAAFVPSDAAAQKLVDPGTVAPEYREAAEKRRAEQLALYQCAKKADDAKVTRRDRVAFINTCLDKNR